MEIGLTQKSNCLKLIGASRAGLDPRQPALRRQGGFPRKRDAAIGNEGRRASPPRNSQEVFFMSDDQDGDEQSAGAVPSPDGGQINIEEQRPPGGDFSL